MTTSATYRLMDPTSYRSGTRRLHKLDGEWHYLLDPDNRGLAEGRQFSDPFAAKFSDPRTAEPRAGDTRLSQSDDPIRQSGGSCSIPIAVQALPGHEEYPSPSGFPNGYLGTAWFTREFTLEDTAVQEDEEQDDEADFHATSRYALILGGVAPAAHVYLDGTYVGYHNMPMVTAEFDVTALLAARPGDRHRLTLVVLEQDLGMLGGYRFGGHRWSGIFRPVWIEKRPAARIRSCWIRATGDGFRAEADILWPWQGTAPLVTGRVAATDLSFSPDPDAPNGVRRYVAELPSEDIPHWRAADPRRVALQLQLHGGDSGIVLDQVTRTVGLQSLQAREDRITEHGSPLFLAGAGQEFFSPSIAPLTDAAVIDRRMRALKDCGFSLFRHHTHVPTPEELAAADRHGIYLVAEVAVVSNFAKVSPYEAALRMLEAYVYQSRHHPALGMYCLGNEGSQVMISDETERRKAADAYALIKSLAPDRMVAAAFGSQGELPDQPNDVETPHLWSHEFRWGHDGLTRVPWWTLRSLTASRPAIIHEYGKFGVWPHEADEEALTVPGYRLRPGRDAARALEEAHIPVAAETVAANSRALSAVCTRTILEEARGAPGCDGFVLWTFFRMGPRNGGIADDAGGLNVDPTALRTGAAAPVALIPDCGFSRRTIPAGARRRVEVTISSFRDLPPGRLHLRFRHTGADDYPLDRESVADDRSQHLDVPAIAAGSSHTVPVDIYADREFLGATTPASSAETAPKRATSSEPPAAPGVRRAAIEAELYVTDAGDRLVGGGADHGSPGTGDHAAAAAVKTDLWVVPEPVSIPPHILLDAVDPDLADMLPEAFSPKELESAARGCRSWDDPGRLREVVSTARPALIVTDHLGESAAVAREIGIGLVFIDTGNFPVTWYPQPYPDLSHDVFRMYVPFRAGWDQGNVATVIEDSPILDGVPHPGWCDLLWFHSIHGAATLRTAAIAADLQSEVHPVIRAVPKLKPAKSVPTVQDPNAVRELHGRMGSAIRSENRGYLFVAPQSAKAHVVVSSCRFAGDSFGRYLLSRILSFAAESESRPEPESGPEF